MDTAEPAPRTAEQRKREVLERLDRETDVWVASADAEGLPYLVPLWFVWHEGAVWLSTRLTNPTGRNLGEGGRTRLAFGDTYDVVLMDGTVETFTTPDVPAAAVAAMTAKWGWDPRRDGSAYGFFRVRPQAVQAWRGVRELPGRQLMRDGVWAVQEAPRSTRRRPSAAVPVTGGGAEMRAAGGRGQAGARLIR